MRTVITTALIVPLSFGILSFTGCATTPSVPTATVRAADDIAADIEAVEFPRFDGTRRDDADYVAEYREADQMAREQWAALVRELMDADLSHEAVAQHLPRRWQQLLWTGADGVEQVRKEAEEVLTRNAPDDLQATAIYFQAQVEGREAAQERDVARAMAAAERFIKVRPADARGATLLSNIADMHESGSAEQIAVYERIINDYEGTRIGTWTKGKLLQATSIGQPFELAFTCAVTNSEIDMQMLRGKVVLIDFWATWCGPCVAKMPQMKELYAEHREDGLEIIGISLDQPEDQGGLERLLTFVEENELGWPQYYQGNGWDSEFSTKWGINGIPTLFLIDREGKLRTVKARQNLEEQVAELLAEGKERAAR